MTLEEALVVLGLGPEATLADAKTARRELALLFHPDRVPAGAKMAERAEQMMKRVNVAFDVVASTLANKTSAEPGESGAAQPDWRDELLRTARTHRVQAAAAEAAADELGAFEELAAHSRNVGLAWLIGGIIVSFVALAASSAGVVFFGAILYGLGRSVRAQSAVSKVRSAVREAREEAAEHTRMADEAETAAKASHPPETTASDPVENPPNYDYGEVGLGALLLLAGAIASFVIVLLASGSSMAARSNSDSSASAINATGATTLTSQESRSVLARYYDSLGVLRARVGVPRSDGSYGGTGFSCDVFNRAIGSKDPAERTELKADCVALLKDIRSASVRLDAEPIASEYSSEAQALREAYNLLESRAQLLLNAASVAVDQPQESAWRPELKDSAKLRTEFERIYPTVDPS